MRVDGCVYLWSQTQPFSDPPSFNDRSVGLWLQDAGCLLHEEPVCWELWAGEKGGVGDVQGPIPLPLLWTKGVRAWLGCK